MWNGLRIPIIRRVRQSVGHSVRGAKKSPLGYELADHRQFVVGDLPRSVSLRHFAKFGEFMVVERKPDRMARVLFLLDLSASQSLGGSCSKRELATSTVERLGTACLAQGHAVACIAFTDVIEEDTGHTTSRSIWQAWMGDIARQRTRSRLTDPAEALEHAWLLCTGVMRVDLVVVVSDFLFREERRRLSDLSDVADVIGIPVSDPLEHQSHSFFGLFVVRDVESGETIMASGVTRSDPSRYLDALGIERCLLGTELSEQQQFIRLQEFFLGRLENDERRV